MSTPSIFDEATKATFIDLINQHTGIVANLTTATAGLEDRIAGLEKALDSMWLLMSTYLVFIMQLGFALLEAGSVRAMNTKNILMQNTLDTCISIVMYWVVGFGISRGDANLGFGDMKQAATELELENYTIFAFLWAFCNAATTIVSGAVTSRIKFVAYMASCVLISGFTYPVVAYWVWSGGWLGTSHGLKLIDFAGGTVVHMVGGFSALMGCIVVGPRTGRFKMNDDGVIEDHRESGHSIVLATIGTFLLWFGWFGFNSGSTLALSNGLYLVAANAAVNSLIATGASGLTIVIWNIYSSGLHDVWELLNGMLCGLVAITPACATVDPWGAIVIGIGSIIVYRCGVRLVSYLHIDDVVDAFAVHGCCGAYGTTMTGLLSTQANCDLVYGAGTLDYSPGHQLGVQLLAVVAVAAFTSACSLTLFLVIKFTVGIRVSEADERVGLDFKYHAGYAYPNLNERVKKAHEQISMETEIAAQVRRAVLQGKGGRFKDAVSMPASPFDSAAGQHAAQSRATGLTTAAGVSGIGGGTGIGGDMSHKSLNRRVGSQNNSLNSGPPPRHTKKASGEGMGIGPITSAITATSTTTGPVEAEGTANPPTDKK